MTIKTILKLFYRSLPIILMDIKFGRMPGLLHAQIRHQFARWLIQNKRAAFNII
jgi:hypothetical protein